MRFTVFHCVLLGFTGFHWVLLGFTGFEWGWVGFARLHWIWMGFYRVERCFTGLENGIFPVFLFVGPVFIQVYRDPPVIVNKSVSRTRKKGVLGVFGEIPEPLDDVKRVSKTLRHWHAKEEAVHRSGRTQWPPLRRQMPRNVRRRSNNEKRHR